MHFPINFGASPGASWNNGTRHLPPNRADCLVFKSGSQAYLTFHTSTGSERVTIGVGLGVLGFLTAQGTLTCNGAFTCNAVVTFNAAATFVAGISLTGGALTIGDGLNMAVGTTTGTRIATSASQKLGFYGASPIVRKITWSCCWRIME